MKGFFKRRNFADWPVVQIFLFWKSFDRVHPLVWLALFGIVLLVIGASVWCLQILAYIGGLIIFVFAAFVVLWMRGKF